MISSKHCFSDGGMRRARALLCMKGGPLDDGCLGCKVEVDEADSFVYMTRFKGPVVTILVSARSYQWFLLFLGSRGWENLFFSTAAV